jgi:DNA-binding transcriptional MerR regulator
MPEKQNSIRPEIRQKIYSLNEIAKFARVTADFIQECERENLIQVTVMHGAIGYGHDTVRRLIRIRHLHRDLGLDLTAIDCILRMRRKIGKLQKQMNDMERRMIEREQELTAEIQRLRKQLSQESDWKTML